MNNLTLQQHGGASAQPGDEAEGMAMFRMKVLAMVAITTLFSANLFADTTNLLTNGGFDQGSTSLVTSGPNPGYSAATGWRTWSAEAGTTLTSELMASTAPGGSGDMLFVSTDGSSSGIYQMFAPIPAGNGVNANILINVVSGTVGMVVAGNAGTFYTWATAGSGWQTLKYSGVGSVNEFGLFNWSNSGASFYVENASVVDPPPPPSAPVPEPGSLLLMGTGLAALASRLRSKAR